MKSMNFGKRVTHTNCEKDNHDVTIRSECHSNSVSVPSNPNWSELTKRVVRENIGAWKNLAKE